MQFFNGNGTGTCSNWSFERTVLWRQTIQSLNDQVFVIHWTWDCSKTIRNMLNSLNKLRDGLSTFLDWLQLCLSWMIWDLDREANLHSNATQTSLAVERPTSWAKTPSERVALIQHKIFWSCWTHLEKAESISDVMLPLLLILNLGGHGLVPSTKPMSPFPRRTGRN